MKGSRNSSKICLLGVQFLAKFIYFMFALFVLYFFLWDLFYSSSDSESDPESESESESAAGGGAGFLAVADALLALVITKALATGASA